MITPTQMRAARAMLDVPQGHVAQHLGIAANTLSKIESGQSDISMSRLIDIQKFYEREGISFTENDGVRWANDDIIVYEGAEQFSVFLTDIYQTAREVGGDFCLCNARPDNWIELIGEEKYHEHSERMKTVEKEFNVRITVKKGEMNFISPFAEYRWIPEEMFNDKSFYAYGDKIAFLIFEGDNSRVLVLKHPEFAQGFKALFDIAWDTVAEVPEG